MLQCWRSPMQVIGRYRPCWCSLMRSSQLDCHSCPVIRAVDTAPAHGAQAMLLDTPHASATYDVLMSAAAGIPLRDMISACSVGYLESTALLDLNRQVPLGSFHDHMMLVHSCQRCDNRS